MYIPSISSASLTLNILFLKNQLIILEDCEYLVYRFTFMCG